MFIDISQKVKEIISESLEIQIEDVTEETNIDNTPTWDSLSNLKLVMEIENEFDIFLEPEDFVVMINFNGILNTVKSYLKEQS